MFLPKVFKIQYFKDEKDAAAGQMLCGLIEISGQTTVTVQGTRLTLGTVDRSWELDGDTETDSWMWGKRLTQFTRECRGFAQILEASK